MRGIVWTLVLAAFLLGGCAEAEPDAPQSGGESEPGAVADVVVTEAGAPIAVAVGQTFAILVEANPGVGYTWEVEEPTTADVVEYRGFFYVDEGEQAAGDSVSVDYRFSAVAAGTTDVVLTQLYRGEDQDPPVQQTHTVTVTEG